MARTDNLTNFLTDIADSIRTKKGSTGEISASDFDSEILNIETGGSTTNNTGGTITGTSASTTQTINTGIVNLKSFCIVKTNYDEVRTGLKLAVIIDDVIMATSATTSFGSYVSLSDTSSNISVTNGVVTIGTSSNGTGLQGEYSWIATEI